MEVRIFTKNLKQARRQDSVTGGAEINFGGQKKFIYMNSRVAWGHKKFIRVWIKQTKWKPIKTVFTTRNSTHSGCRLKILAIFHELFSEDQKKRSLSQTFYEIRCESTKITKKRFLLHFSSPESVNFFEVQFSLGEHSFHLGGTAPECPPVAPALT